MKIRTLLLGGALAMALPMLAETRYVGGDVSLLPAYEEAGAQYKNHEGEPISDLLQYLHQEGMNSMRVRLFVDPAAYAGSDKDPNACQDLEYIIPLCKRIVDDGYALMLDFHYSDTWADPAKQWTPAAWKDLSDEELYQKIYDYTKETLGRLKEEGITPAFIQPGNEISYGMLWGPVGTPEGDLKKALMGSNDNWERFGHLLRQAIKACREECPDAKIVIHTERVAQVDVERNFYDKMRELDIDYDIIGLSYYPYWHGTLDVLRKALDDLSANYPDKELMIVETGYPYKWEVPGTDQKVDYPYTDAGQNQFATDLVDLLLKYDKMTGLYWWWLEYNAYGTKLEGWYNAPFFDSTTGKAGSALKTLCRFADPNAGILEIGADNAAMWYDLSGSPVSNPRQQGIYIRNGRKVMHLGK